MLSELCIDTELTLFIFTSFYNVQKVMIYNRKQHGCPGVDYYGNMASDTYLSCLKHIKNFWGMLLQSESALSSCSRNGFCCE